MTPEEKQVVSYAFMAYVFENGVQISEIFTPLIKLAIFKIKKQIFNVNDIYKEIISIFGKKIIKVIIQAELFKLQKKQIVKQIKEHKWELISKDNEYVKGLDETKSKIDIFFRDFRNFINSEFVDWRNVGHATIVKKLKDYCNKNFHQIAEYYLGSSVRCNVGSSKDFEKVISDFFEKKIICNASLKETFGQIFHGATLMMIAEECHQRDETQFDFSDKIIYLDTNILLRFLSLQDEYLNEVGLDLYELLKSFNMQIRITKKTLNEFNYLIKGYKEVCGYIVQNKQVNHVYQVLRNRNCKVFDIDPLLKELYKSLEEMQIYVDYDSEIDNQYYAEMEAHIDELSKSKEAKNNKDKFTEKNSYNENGQQYETRARHDISLIYLIKSMRNKEKNYYNTNFENTKYFLVTGDTLLLNQNKKIDGDRIRETIGDVTLTTLLYFKNPQLVKDISIQNFIISHTYSNKLSIKNWIDYIKIIVSKYKSNEYNEKTFGYLVTEVMLDDAKFENNSIEDIIAAGISEYQSLDKELNSKKSELQSKENNIKELELKIAGMECKFEDSQKENKKERERMRKENLNLYKKIRRSLFIFFSSLILIGLIFYFAVSKTLGGIFGIIGFVCDILTLIDKYKKRFIKD